MPQDLPPAGGYAPVQFKRNLPARAFKPRYVVGVSVLIMSYGWYKYFGGNRELLELSREKQWARVYLMPMLQAEEDRDMIRRVWADQAREKELLGEVTKPYHSDRFVRPTYAVTPEHVLKEK